MVHSDDRRVMNNLDDTLAKLSLLSGADKVTAASVTEALDVVRQVFARYAFGEVALSFNGGKDCTVVFHLLRIVLHELFPNDESKSIAQFWMVYFDKQGEFQEVRDFMEQVREEFGFEIEVLKCSYQEGLQHLYDRGCRAVLMGQRSTDPFSAHLEHFTVCDEGWPAVMRVNPILNWDYKSVWGFLRGCGLSYCKLYDQGFTSLGPEHATSVNPMLQQGDDAPPKPAYALAEEHHHHERVGREAQTLDDSERLSTE